MYSLCNNLLNDKKGIRRKARNLTKFHNTSELLTRTDKSFALLAFEALSRVIADTEPGHPLNSPCLVVLLVGNRIMFISGTAAAALTVKLLGQIHYINQMRAALLARPGPGITLFRLLLAGVTSAYAVFKTSEQPW